MHTPVANKRASFIPFSSSNAILAIVSGAHAINHAFSTLMPLIYPLVVAEFRLSYSQIGLMVGVGAFWASVLGWAIDHFGFATGFHIMTLSYIVAGLALLPTREIIQVHKA